MLHVVSWTLNLIFLGKSAGPDSLGEGEHYSANIRESRGLMGESHLCQNEAVTKLVPSAEADSVCCASLSRHCRAGLFRFRRYAAGSEFGKRRSIPLSFVTEANAQR
jgi:hypothetical protein